MATRGLPSSGANLENPLTDHLFLWLPEHDNQPLAWQLAGAAGHGGRLTISARGRWATVADFIAGFHQATAEGKPLSSYTAVVVLPATRVSLHTLEVEGRITPVVRRSLPWRLEDELIDDVERLHIALLSHQDNLARLAVTTEADMARWQQWLASAGLAADCWLPGSLLLPVEDLHGYQLSAPGQVVIRYGQWQTLACDDSWQPQLLAALHQEQPTLTLVDLGDLDRLDWLPPLAQPLPTLLQGRWRVTSPLRQQWLRWRPVALMGVLLVVLSLFNACHGTRQLQQQAVQQQQAAAEIFRRLFPHERIVVLETQMQQQLAAMHTPDSDGPGLLGLLNTIAPTLAGFGQLQADSMNFGNGQLTILARAPDFDTFNRLRSSLEQIDTLQVALEALERDGDQVTGTLVIDQRKENG